MDTYMDLHLAYGTQNLVVLGSAGPCCSFLNISESTLPDEQFSQKCAMCLTMPSMCIESSILSAALLYTLSSITCCCSASVSLRCEVAETDFQIFISNQLYP